MTGKDASAGLPADRVATAGRTANDRLARSAPPLAAVLFDMDGVVTDTALAHAAAWKRVFDAYLGERSTARGEPFRPFDIEVDYRQFVDGKPRHDGVAGFLASRGISLPHGSDADPPEAETICGLAKRKNRQFLDWLDQHPVRAFPAALRLIDELRRAGIKTAVFSASRNAGAVLRHAGVGDLFDVRVDGNDLAALDLPGKPDPAMLLEAAARLGTSPAHAAVIEDAIAGVAAGRDGGFAMVVGVDRGRNGDALGEAGADLVVRSLAELRLDGNRLTPKTLPSLPVLGDRQDEIRNRLAHRLPAVFLDYDGTLTPIVEDHTKAFLADDVRRAVAALAERCTVAIVSGRDLEALRGFVRLDNVYYAGSHGFEIAGPGGSGDRLEKGAEFLPDLDAAEKLLRARLAGIPGHAVERKRYSIAVHYRRVAESDTAAIEAGVDEVLHRFDTLRKGFGKKVFEIRPDIEWDKGYAVLWLIDRLNLGHADVVPLYVGDDITDEDAFRALAGTGICVLVGDGDRRTTAADYALGDPDDVRRFLEFLTGLAADAARDAGANG